MDEDEKQKVKRLMKEKGKVDDQKLEWMYKEDKPDDEDYLLGKRIDKAMEKQENSKEDDVGALFNERIQANIAMDMQTKMREDPLFAIRKKEEEAKRRLLQNPVKMKRLQQMIDQKKKESKEHKVKKKHKNRDSDSDDDIMAKYLNIINRKQKSGNIGGQKSQSEHQRESQRERSPSLIEKEDEQQSRTGVRSKQQSRTGVRSKQRESDSHDEDYQRKETNYRDREKKEGRYDDWRSREGRRDLESDRERHRQHRDMDTGRMQRYSNLNFDHRENLHGNNKVDCSRRRRDSDSDNDGLSRNYDKSKQRKKEWSDSERAGYHRNKGSEDSNYSSNRKDIRLDKHRHSDIDEERKEKKFDKRNFSLEYRGSSKETGKKQKHSDSEDDHHGKKQRHSDSEDDDHGKKKRHSDSEDDHHGKMQRHSDSEDDHQGKKQRHSNSEDDHQGKKQRHSNSEDDHHSNKRIKSKRSRSSPESEDDRKSNDGKLKNKTYGYGLVMPRGVSPVRKFEKTNSSDRSGSSKMSGSRSPKGRKSRSPSPKRMKPSQKQSKTRSPVNKRSGRCVLSEEERKRRLEEMMDNAKWREDQRKQNVTRYREEEKREEENQNKDFDSSHFLKPMISGHVENSSVEDRLKRNKYNILRTNADLDRGFSKK